MLNTQTPHTPIQTQQSDGTNEVTRRNRDRTSGLVHLSGGITMHEASDNNVQLYGDEAIAPLQMYTKSVELRQMGKAGLLIHPRFDFPIWFFQDKPSYRITAPRNTDFGTFRAKALNAARALTEGSPERIHIRGIHGDSGLTIDIISTRGQAEIYGKGSINPA